MAATAKNHMIFHHSPTFALLLLLLLRQLYIAAAAAVVPTATHLILISKLMIDLAGRPAFAASICRLVSPTSPFDQNGCYSQNSHDVY
jgi:hypothetical protein